MKEPFTVTYDPEARAVYITLRDDTVAVTREITDTVLLDLDADANLVGIEVLDVDEAPS